MTVDLQRRTFFKMAGSQLANRDIHLPWLSSVDHFLENCTRCDTCLESCPEQIIEQGDGGFPTVNFKRGECTFCGDCASQCPEHLFNTELPRPWGLELTITENCFARRGIVCQSCRDVCDARAVEFSHMGAAIAKPVVNESLCTHCGACVSACPASAIEIAVEDPPQ